MNTDVKYVLVAVVLAVLVPLGLVVILGGIDKWPVVLFTVTTSIISISVMLYVFKRWMINQDVIFLTKDTKITIKD
jgi:uncharacterized membrane protein (DUF4010 family)